VTTRRSAVASTIAAFLFTVISVVASGQSPVTTAQSNASGVPKLVKLSGSLEDASGNLLNGTVGVMFAIYTDQTGGAPIWQETQNVQFSKGDYTVLLGNGTSEGIPANVFASGESRWLGVTALLPGEEEHARVLLASVPYALKAVDADTLGGLPASAYLRADELNEGGAGAAAGVSNKAAAATPMAGLNSSAGGPSGSASSVGSGTPSANPTRRSGQANIRSEESGQITIVQGTSGTHTFMTRWMTPPLCTLTPTSDPHASGGYWVTSSTSSLTVNVHYSGQITFNYRCLAANTF
jgi:hypothetical protein